MEMNLLFVHGSHIGYGRLGVELAEQLKSMDVTIYDHLPDPINYYEDHGYKSGVSNVVCWVSTPTHARGWFKDQIPCMFTMWEATQLPESFRENLHEFDTIIVPSKQNLELFSRYHDNVKFVPLGVDPKVWHYTSRREGTFFNFLIGGSGPRKGTDLAHKAFRKVFKSWPKDMPVPKLIMKNTRGEDYYGERIEIIGGRISAEDEVALYETAHCYLQPSRGEGFGLQPLQALAQGIPTILTAAHGHDAFAHLGYGIPATLGQSGYFIFGDAGDWWEPDFDELCELMEYVYLNYGEAKSKAKQSADEINRQFTWRNTAYRFIDAIGQERLIPYSGNHQWYVPESRLYTLITNRDWHCEIAGTNFYFVKGKEYHESADVKRILFEAGLLDSNCLTGDDIGLAPEQAARIPAYTAAQEFCPLCHQKLGTGEKREAEPWVG